jgi:hypothetical protein
MAATQHNDPERRGTGSPAGDTSQVSRTEPLPQDYSRVTHPERFAVLQETAELLLEDLSTRYIVERRESKETLGRDADGPLVRVVRLIPHSPAAAPLAIAFTDFPSLVLRLGRWYEIALPGCGCDACDEDPAEVADDLRTQVSALVEGGLWERVHRRLTTSWSETRLIGPGFKASQDAPLDPREARAARRGGFAAPVQWAPWARRPQGA